MKQLFFWALERAKVGRLFWINLIFRRVLPFNVPHGIKLLSIKDDSIQVALPDRRSNRNHLKGLHACAIATACEFCSGMAVLIRFDMSEYRLIMNRIEVDYLRRPGKGGSMAVTEIPADLQKEVARQIESSMDGAARIQLISELVDSSNQVVARANVHWHIKPWSKVRYDGNSKS